MTGEPPAPSIAIRPARLDDSGAIAAIYEPNVRGSTTSFEDAPPDAAEIAARMRAILPRYPWLVAEFAGEVVGYAYGSSHRARPAYRWSVEVSVYVDARVHGRGIGRALYVALFAHLAKLGYYRAFAGVTLPNAASEALHRAVGFERIGVFERVGYKLGGWRDVGWYARDLRPADPAPAEPRAND